MKKLIATMLVIFAILCLTGCNIQVIDTNFLFNHAQIAMPDGTVVEGRVESWRDYSDGDQVQVKIDGITYLTDTTRCVLWNE